MEYSREFGSNFPNELISVGIKKDVDDTVKNLVIQYYQLVDSGNYNDASELYEANKETLEPYMINMAYINMLAEELYNIGLNVLDRTPTMVSDRPPAHQSVGSFWYREV